ncbi:MAG: cation-translocating P-type ATPase [Verrucomicrobia bacterium]|nr:cation-translocating P-type ATPase [Verrucomicrobiota bacterium]
MQTFRAAVAVLCSLSLFFPLTLGIQGLIATIAQFFCGWPLYTDWKRNPLPVIGVTGAYLFSFYLIFTQHFRAIYFETSIFLITFFLFSRILEKYYQAKQQKETLLSIHPQQAHVKREGKLMTICAREIQIGDIFIVNPNERIPADGQIEKGESIVDETMLFGGKNAVEKQVGHPIFAGSMNHHGTLIGQATKPGNQTFLSHIVKSNPEPETRAQKIALPTLLLIALLTWIGWQMTAQGFLNALSVILIASPQAIKLARTLPFTLACNNAYSKGIFIKETKAIEAARKIDRIIIDKRAIINQDALSIEKITIPESYFPIIKTLCQQTTHPAAKAILEYLKTTPSISTMMVFRSTPGQGVSGYFDERKYFLGSMTFFQQQTLPTEKFQKPYQEEPGLLIAFGTEKLSIGYILLSDEIQSDSKQAILDLKELKIQTQLLSTDQKKQTERTAAALHIDTYQAEIESKDQIKYVEMAKREGKTVAMVGENPEALAASDIGFGKIGLKEIVETIKLSKTTFQKIRQNQLITFGYHLIAVPLAALGYIPPTLAGVAMVLSIVIISHNTLRKKTTKAIVPVQIKNELLELEHERSMD